MLLQGLYVLQLTAGAACAVALICMSKSGCLSWVLTCNMGIVAILENQSCAGGPESEATHISISVRIVCEVVNSLVITVPNSSQQIALHIVCDHCWFATSIAGMVAMCWHAAKW